MELPSSNIKKFVIFQKMKLSSSNIKKFLRFSQKKAFLIFREIEIFYISENGNPPKILCISGSGTFLYFRKRNFLIFQEELPKSQKSKSVIFP